jgi:hypothetical protein
VPMTASLLRYLINLRPKLSDSIEIHILQIASKWLLLCVHI